MKNKKKDILVNLLVICLYFIWPYFFYSIANLFNISENLYLLLSFGVNFVFLFVIIYIYKKKFDKYCKKIEKKFWVNIFSSLKIFLIGLVVYLLFNVLFNILNVPALSNSDILGEMFKKLPVMFILNTLFYYPIIEEIIFKMSFKEIIKKKWSFVIFTGLFNAFFHIIFSYNNFADLLYLLPLSALIGSLSYIYYETDNIMYPITIRVFYNLIPCIGYVIRLITNGFTL